MLELLTSTHVVSVLTFGGLLGLVGLVDLFLHAKRKGAAWTPPFAFAVALALTGTAAVLADLPGFVWQPALLVGALCLALSLVRSPLAARLGKAASTLVNDPRVQSAALLAAGLGLVVCQSYALDRKFDQEVQGAEAYLDTLVQPPDLVQNSAVTGYTDDGNAIPLWMPSGDSSEEHLSGAEVDFLRGNRLDFNVIQTSPSDASYNCHGWIFTGGRCWVRGAAVGRILEQNRYRAVARPQPGDLAVYRSASGEVTHTALVRSVTGSEALLESKWGRLGRFLHTTAKHPYNTHKCTYYRSDRNGHLLAGTDAGIRAELR